MSTFILGTESHQNFSWNEPSASLCFFQDYKSVDDYHLLQEQSYSPRRADLFSMAVLQLSRAPSVWITWSEIVSNQHTKDRWIKDCSDFLQFFFFFKEAGPKKWKPEPAICLLCNAPGRTSSLEETITFTRALLVPQQFPVENLECGRSPFFVSFLQFRHHTEFC